MEVGANPEVKRRCAELIRRENEIRSSFYLFKNQQGLLQRQEPPQYPQQYQQQQ